MMNTHFARWHKLFLAILSSILAFASGGLRAEDDGLKVLIDTIERKSANNIQRDQMGKLVRLYMPLSFVNDTNLSLIAECPDLEELSLSFTTKDYAHLTSRGFKQLQRILHLRRLKISCPLNIASDCFAGICQLTNLTSLSLMAAPSQKNYFFLTNLTQLAELSIEGADNFDGAELRQLSALPNLKQLTIGHASVRDDDWLNTVRLFPALTNAAVYRLNRESPPKMEKLTWSKYAR